MARFALRSGFALLLAALAGGPVCAQQAPTGGVLVVESDPSRAFVLIDSARVGSTPARVAVGEGVHRVQVLYTGYDPYDEAVVVRAGETVRVAARLVRRTGTVSVDGLPAGAVVTIDGARADGPTAVPTGDVRVRVEAPGRRPAEAVVGVEWQSETRVAYGVRRLDAAAFSLSLFVPSAAQFRGGRPLVGAAVVAGIGAGLGVALAARADERSIGRDVDAAYAVYRAAGSEAAAVSARAEVERLVEGARGARRRQHAALAAAGAVYAASAVDAFFRHVLQPGLRSSVVRPPRVEAGVGGAGVRLALTF